MSHGDRVTRAPDGFRVTAMTDSCPIAAIVNDEKQFYGVQFHPEVTHTKPGTGIFENFIRKICGLETMWNSASIIEDAIVKIREKVGSEKVILGMSGGVALCCVLRFDLLGVSRRVPEAGQVEKVEFSAADHQNIFYMRMYRHWHVHNHFIINKLILFREYNAAVSMIRVIYFFILCL